MSLTGNEPVAADCREIKFGEFKLECKWQLPEILCLLDLQLTYS